MEEKIKRAGQRLARARRQLSSARARLTEARDDVLDSRSKRDAARKNLASVRVEFQLTRLRRRLSLPRSFLRGTKAVLDRPGLRLLALPFLFLLERTGGPARGAAAWWWKSGRRKRKGRRIDPDEASMPGATADARSGGAEVEAHPSEAPVISEVWAVEFTEPERFEWVRASDLPRGPEEQGLRFEGVLLGLKAASREEADETARLASLDLFALLSHPDGRIAGVEADPATRKSHETSRHDPKSAAERAQLLPEGLEAGGRLHDIVLVTDRLVRLRFDEVRTGFVLRLFQHEPVSRTLHLVDEAAIGEGVLQFADVELMRPLMPVLFVVSDASGVVTAVSVLPFPSLCRGGLHFPELLDGLSGDGYVEALAAYSRRRLTGWAAGVTEGGFTAGSVAVDPRSALGTEPIFSRDLREWLRAVFRTGLEPFAQADGSQTPGERFLIAELARQRSSNDPPARSGRGRLCINASAVPTLAALSHTGALPVPALPQAALPFLVNGAAAGGPAWAKMHVPAATAALSHLQDSAAPIPFPVFETHQSASPPSPPEERAEDTDFPWAVTRRDTRFVQEANLIFPVAPDGRRHVVSAPALARRARRLLVVLPVREKLSDRLIGLRQQDWEGEVLPVVLLRHTRERQDAGVTLERNLGTISQFTASIYGSGQPWSVRQAVGKLDGDGVLLISEGVVLHDPRTLTTLCAIGSQRGVATAGCALIQDLLVGKRHQIIMHSAGYLPTGATDGMLLQEEDYSSLLPPGTYPVAMNSSALFFSARDAWDGLHVGGDLGEDGTLAGAEMAEAAASGEGLHLCTSLVTAGWSAPTNPRSLAFPDESAARALLADAIRVSPVR